MAEQIPGEEPGARSTPAEASAALQEFAQAFLTLEHAFCFYPEGHQARAAPLQRLIDVLCAEARAAGEGSVACAGESVVWRGALQERPSPVVQKLASLLGTLGIVRLVWAAGLTEEELRRFMTRVAASRGAARRTAWEDAGEYEHLRVEGPDYQAMMALSAAPGETGRRRDLWRGVLARALGGVGDEPSEEDLTLLREAWGDPGELASLLVEVIGPAAQHGREEAVGPLRGFAALVERAATVEDPSQGAMARGLSEVGRRLPPPLRLRLLEATLDAPAGGLFDAAFGSLAPGEGVALLGENFALDPAQIERLTRVFQLLVPRQLDRMELTPLMREHLPANPAEDDPLADNVWEEVQELLTGEAADFMSPAYREQLRGLAARQANRQDQEAALGRLPGLAESLEPAQVAEAAQLIQFEQVRLATSPERYRDALDGLAGSCGAALAAGDRDRGMAILRRLLDLRGGDDTLAGPRSEIDLALKAVVAVPVARSLVVLLPSFSQQDRAAAAALAALARETVVPVVLDELAAEDDPTRRREIATLLEQSGPGVAPLVLQRLAGASDAVARLLLPLIAEAREPGTVPTLLALLGRGDQRLRRDALRALLRVDSEEVRRALRPLLADADEEIVQMAAAHLGAVGSPETVRELLQSLTKGQFGGRRAEQTRRAILVLGRMKAPEAVAPLGELLLRRAWINRRVQEQVAEDAAKALARIGGDEARRALEQAAARGSEKIAALSRRLLARPGGG